jgi:glyoxylase-like metal-dependent hydrolase (beta-lactamase superfamily II)
VLATHGHTDHVGAAAFLCNRNGARFEITIVEWMTANLRYLKRNERASQALKEFIARYGGWAGIIETYEQETSNVSRYLGALPEAFHRLEDGKSVTLGGRKWRIIGSAGHADEHISFYCDDSKVLIAGDQILPRISPVVAVSHIMPNADPLGAYLRSLSKFRELPDDTLVLPGHGDPFCGLQQRIDQLTAHHERRLSDIERLAAEPTTAFEIAQRAFPGAFVDGQIRLAVGETLAHLNRLLDQRRLVSAPDKNGVIRFASPMYAAA